MSSPLRVRTVLAAAAGIAIALTAGGPAGADEAQTTTRITMGHSGAQADGDSNAPSISSDGRWLVFSSNATNLVPGDTNDLLDLFLYDRTTGDTELVTRGVGGVPSNGGAYGARISADGGFVTFYSAATNLVPDDTDSQDSVFVWDRASKEITRLPGADALWPDISADGRYVTYSTYAPLVPEDTDTYIDVYVYDRTAGEASLITKTRSGGAAGGYESTISDDGRYVAFGSDSTELLEEHVGGGTNVFLRDRQTGATTLISAPPGGASGSGRAGFPEISGDGRFVVFGSSADDLVPDDTNAEHDVFLWERATGEITAVSVTPDGRTAAGFSMEGRVSADGRYVTFWSTAMDLSGAAASGWLTQTYLFDRATGRNRLVAVPTEGTNGGGEGADVSADGRIIGFQSSSEDLVPGDTNGARDVFVTVLS